MDDRFFPLTDVANISRGYVDPPSSLFRFNGKPSIGLAIGMKTGGNLLAFGEKLEETMTEIIQDLPLGVSVERVSAVCSAGSVSPFNEVARPSKWRREFY